MLTIFFATAAFAQWERSVGTAKGDWTDNPPSHSLYYFTDNACVSRGSSDRTEECYATTSQLKLIEHVGKFVVYDLSYTPPEKYTGGLSVLVESAPGVFHEIYFRENTVVGSASRPTRIIRADGQTLVVESFEDGSRIYVEHFLSLSDDGTRLMHPERIKEAAPKLVPENSGISLLSSTINYGDLAWEFYVGPADPRNHPERGSNGSIIVHFKIEGGDFAPKSAEFVPLARAR